MHPTRNEGSGDGTRGSCAEPLGHKRERERERWWAIEMTITSSTNTFSNTGNIPTLHQPTLVTVTTVTLTGFPQLADPHHLPQVSLVLVWWNLFLYVLQGIAKCSGYEDCECTCVSIHNWKDVPCCKAMLDDLYEVEMKEMKEKSDGDLGSWKRVVTTADDTWQTRGWHSKNAT